MKFENPVFNAGHFAFTFDPALGTGLRIIPEL